MRKRSAHSETVSAGLGARLRPQAQMMAASPSNASSEFDPYLGEFGEVSSDMPFQDRFLQMCIDAKLRRHQCRCSCRRLHPGIAFAPDEVEDRGDRPCPVYQLTLDLGEPQGTLLRLDQLVGVRARRKVTSPSGFPDASSATVPATASMALRAARGTAFAGAFPMAASASTAVAATDRCSPSIPCRPSRNRWSRPAQG